MNSHFKVSEVESIGGMLSWMAKRLRLSINALIKLGGSHNSSLMGMATGSRVRGDLGLVPILRVLSAVNYELVAIPKGGQPGLLLRRDGAEDLMVVGLGGNRIELTMQTFKDVPVLLNTLASATNMTVTGLVRASNVNSLGLVGLANGTSDHKDVRLRNLLAVIDAAGFEVCCRPVHATRREARTALAAAYRD